VLTPTIDNTEVHVDEDRLKVIVREGPRRIDYITIIGDRLVCVSTFRDKTFEHTHLTHRPHVSEYPDHERVLKSLL
jgi:hypothetical protein